MRGVHAPDKESAIIYLTHGEKGRNMPGGDRLGTDGGVYTSNSTNVADRFKNPEFGTEDGWVGRVVYPYILCMEQKVILENYKMQKTDSR